MPPAAEPPPPPPPPPDTPVHHPSDPTPQPPNINCGRPRLRFDPDAVRASKPDPPHVLVIALGSRYIRHASATAVRPRKLPNLVALPLPLPSHTTHPHSPPHPSPQENYTHHHHHTQEQQSHAAARKSAKERERLENDLQAVVSRIAAETKLTERRRGGGKPIPWKVELEPVDAQPLLEEIDTAETIQLLHSSTSSPPILAGRSAERALHDPTFRDRYEFVNPINDGRLVSSHAPSIRLRAALDAMLATIGRQFRDPLSTIQQKQQKQQHQKHQQQREHSVSEPTSEPQPINNDPHCATTHVVLIVPETADRADIVEYVSAIFRVDQLAAAAVFVHHNSVASALGAGLSTCAVIDVGYSATTVACVDEACVIGDSRVYLPYGTRAMWTVFDKLLRKSGAFDDVCTSTHQQQQDDTHLHRDVNLSSPQTSRAQSTLHDDAQAISVKTFEQLCGFNVQDNDTMGIAMIRAPQSGIMFRVKCGIGVRAVPAYGLFRPALFEAVAKLHDFPLARLSLSIVDRNSEEDNLMSGLFDDTKRSAAAATSVPFGRFANELVSSQSTDATGNALPPWSSIVDALIWSVMRAAQSSTSAQTDGGRDSERKTKYLKSVLLVGGGTALDDIADVMEAKIKRTLEERRISAGQVTVIDGTKGSGDEELQAAEATLRSHGLAGLEDDGDPANLAWKGGAVMVEADAVKDLWVYRDEWFARGVRCLKERAPFFW